MEEPKWPMPRLDYEQAEKAFLSACRTPREREAFEREGEGLALDPQWVEERRRDLERQGLPIPTPEPEC